MDKTDSHTINEVKDRALKREIKRKYHNVALKEAAIA